MAKNKELTRDMLAQSPEQLEHVTLVEDRCKKGAHADEDLKSYSQLAYYAGQQHIAVNKTTNTLMPLPKEPWQVQYTANRIMPAVRTELAKITRNKLTKKVVPASSEDNDIRAARIAEKVAEWLEYELDLQGVDEEYIMWALTTRIGFVKPVWNPNKGMVVAVEDGKPAVHEGDPDIEVLSLFELKWDPAASRWDDVRWVIHERTRTIEYVEKVYGKKVAAEDGLSESSIYDGKLKNLTSSSDMFNMTSTKAENCTSVKEMWEAPSSEYPKGRRITTASGVELLYEEDIGFGEKDDTDREIPIFPLSHISVPGKIIGSNVVEQLMPVQREYNKSRGQIIENKNLMANPKWIAEAGSIVDDEISSEPGAVVWVQPGFNYPQMMQPTSLGADVDKNIERCLEEFMFISGQQEVSHGSTAPGVTAGVAIELLQEQDDTKLAPSVGKYSRAKQRYMKYLLKIVKFHYNTNRTIKLVGKDHRMDVMDFTGSDLTSIDIRFEDTSQTQLTAMGRKQYIVDLIQYGILLPQDKDLIIRMLELGIHDELYDAMEVDVEHALKENGLWAKGDFSPIVRDFFNHEVHIAQHDKFRKSDEYTGLPEVAQVAIDQHVALHKEYMYQVLLAQVPQQPAPGQQPENGATPEGGQPGIDMNKVMGALKPEEQQALHTNPGILDAMK